MVKRYREGALTDVEKRIVKALLGRGMRNQDIQALINFGRQATINSARITGVKNNNSIEPATNEEVDFFLHKKKSFDPKTNLNVFDDERIIRSREAMILAVSIFNNPQLLFKTEVFSVLANVAWTYLLHEFYSRKGVQIVDEDGNSLLLSQMVAMPDSPLSDGMRRNLLAIKEIRDSVEHRLLGRSDHKWLPIFQACCLNFDKMLSALFGEGASISPELSYALQFAKIDFEQVVSLYEYNVPAHIQALDARLKESLNEEQLDDLEYQFKVIYTFTNAPKTKAHFQFIHPDSDEAEKINNVLIKYKTADHLYPYKPKQVAKIVRKKSGRRFTVSDHTFAWKKHKVRPAYGAKHPENTKKEFCVYHPAHNDYTYSDAWVDFLGSGLIQTQKAMMAARQTAERKLTASLS